jgi:ankyrin repeat protein
MKTMTDNLDVFANFQRDLNILMEDTKRNADNQAYKAIDEWVNAPKIDQQYDKHLSARLEGTCDWIFRHPAYREWMSIDYSDTAAKFLWICGPAGHGKTVLCARLAQHLAEPAAFPLAYAFSSSLVQAGGQPDGIIRSWISQWTRRDPIAFYLVRDNLQSVKAGQRASQAEIWAVFKELVSQIEHCTCILDGFDEYSRSDDSRRDFLRKLKEVVAGTRTRCLIASRGETDIELELCSAAGKSGEQTMLECKISQKDIQADITLYSKMAVAKKLPRKDESLQQELATYMAEKCEGMFLWIKLQQEQLRGGKSKKELRKIVESMPTGLNQTYERNWTSIMNLPDADRSRAISILRWTTLALRPLNVAELTEALVVQPDVDGAHLSVDDLPEEINDDYIDGEIKSLCGSLIEIRSAAPKTPLSSQTIHLVHVSVKEYLLSVLPTPSGLETISTSILGDAAQNIDLARVCLRYLNLEDVWGVTNIFEGDKERRPFLNYAAKFWLSHTNATKVNVDTLNRLLNEFFEPGNTNFDAWATCFESSKSEKELEKDSGPSNSLYYASFFGLASTMEYLHDLGNSDIDFAGGRFGTALQSTCVAGHLAAFDRLLEWGADVNAKGGEFGTALNAAAAGGQETMVKGLVSREASLAFTDARGQTPLHLACCNGHTRTVQFLLKAGAYMSISDEDGWTPLNSAANSGHLEVVKLLLDQGADTSISNQHGWTPLNSAANSGHLEVVKLLLNQGADTSISNQHGWTPLNSAANSGHLEVVKLLLDQEADTSISSQDGWTPLNLAANNGHLEVVKLLLDQGANTSISNQHGWTPLNSAAANGHLEVVKLLLDRGADIDAKTLCGVTSLCKAISDGEQDIIDTFMKRGADLLIVDIYGRTCLDWLRILGSQLEKFDLWIDGHHESLSKGKQTKHLRQSIRDISCRLMEAGKNKSVPGFHELGHCLKFMGLVDEAIFAFQQQILTIDDCGLASHSVYCNMCRSSPIKGIRRVCQICPDVDICETCANKISSGNTHPVCQNHPFLEVSNRASEVACAQSTSTNREEINSWLRALCSRV